MNKYDGEELNDLYELKDFMKNNFNLDVNIRIPNGYVSKITIQDIYLKLLIQIIILIVSIYFLIIQKKKYTNIFIKIILTFILLYILYKILRYLYSIYLYYIIYKDDDDNDNSISYKNINFNTGDIIQEKAAWYSKWVMYIHLLNKNHRYLHGGMIIKFKNKNYLLHMTPDKVGYSGSILEFNDFNFMEICPLENYIKDNYYSTRYYKLFKTNNNNKITNYKLFNALKEIDIKKIFFKFNIHIPENNDYESNFSKNYNCLNFIFKILYKLNVIPLFNFQNILYNDLIFLPNLSNNIYNKEIIINAN